MEEVELDSGGGWRSPRVAKIKEERESALEAQLRRRAILRGLGTGFGALGLAALGGAALSPQGRTSLGGLLASLSTSATSLRRPPTPKLAAQPDPAAIAGASKPETGSILNALGVAVSSLPKPDATALSAADGQETSPPGSADIGKRPDRVGSAQGEAGSGAVGAATGEGETYPGSPSQALGSGPFEVRTGAANPSSSNDQSGKTPAAGNRAEAVRSGSQSGAGQSSAEGAGIPAVPTPSAMLDPRRVDPYGSDSKAPSGDTPTPAARAPSSNLPKGSRFAIAKLGVNAPVVAIGIDPQGRMLSPANPKDVGWFDLGPLPGSFGNAIMTGHVDWNDGSLGVFAGLKLLAAGDLVEFVTPASGIARFQVKWLRTYVADKAPINEILGQNVKERELTMITCAGTFDRATRNYSHRLVVRCGTQ